MALTSQHTIKQVVEANYLNASVLYYFGITIDQYQDFSLEKICAQKKIHLPSLISRLEQNDQSSNQYLAILKKDLSVVLAYLKYAHKNFIKIRLPFLSKLIASTSIVKFSDQEKMTDLKFIFPMFVEDFIKHIYQEEDELFTYVSLLNQNKDRKTVSSGLILKMQKFSLQKFHDKHLDEDEMMGLRELTNNYHYKNTSSLEEKILFSELRSLDHELKRHALIENDILVPKAIEIEMHINSRLSNLASLN